MSILYVSQKKEINKRLEEYAKKNGYQYFFKEFSGVVVQYANDGVIVQHDALTTNEDGTIYGFMLGEIYDIESRKTELIKAGHCFKQDTDIEFIIHLYEEEGINALQQLNGKFVLFLVNTVYDEYLLVNDRYGLYRCFYVLSGNEFVFCNEPRFLCDAISKIELDEEAVNEFFNFGYPLWEKTLIRGINLLAGASIIQLKTGDMFVSKYWDCTYLKKNNRISFSEAVSNLGNLWIKAVEKIVTKHDKIILTLSGGLDSRAILAAIDYLGLNHKIHRVYTWGQKDCLDIIIAKKLAQIAGVEHLILEIEAESWWKNVDSIIDNTFGAKNIIESNSIVFKKIEPKYVILNGFLGDVVLGGSYLETITDVQPRDIEARVSDILRKNTGLRKTDLLKEYKKINLKIDGNYESKDWYLINTRGMFMINVLPLGDRFNYLYPFFDNEIIDFVYSLPDEWRISGRIYKEMLIKFFPKYFNEIPWQKTGFPINSIQNEFQSKQNNELIVLFGASELGKIALETVKCHYGQVCFCDNDKCKWYTCVSGVKVIPPYKLKNLNYKKLLITSMYWKEIGVQLVEMGITNFDVFKKDYRDYDKWFRTPGVFEFVWGILLSSKCERRNYFNTSEVKKLLHNHMLGRIDAARDIGLLVTFELFCRRFIDDSNNFDSLDIPEN